jgi:lipoprotein-anchoring transpeptidase ErfK/SrfK
MNTTRHSITHRSNPRRRPQATRVSRRQYRPFFGPRIVLHVLVGALTFVSAQALLSPLSRSWGEAVESTVAYASQPAPTAPSSPTTPALSAASLSTTASPPAEHVPPRGGVLSDLSTSIGQKAAPAATTWRGVTGQEVNRRSEPNRSKPPVGTLAAGTPVEVVDWVSGEQVEPRNDAWARLSDGTYVYSTSLRRTGDVEPTPLPANAPTSGRWVDVNLTQQIATAYDGTVPQRSALISAGQPGWETPVGVFPVLRRLEKDTMDGRTLVGQGPDGAGSDYKVENVRYVQYFTDDGAAIHENYWRRPATFGMPGSHGCIGMAPADAQWFWNFATVGTPIVVHE